MTLAEDATLEALADYPLALLKLLLVAHGTRVDLDAFSRLGERDPRLFKEKLSHPTIQPSERLQSPSAEPGAGTVIPSELRLFARSKSSIVKVRFARESPFLLTTHCGAAALWYEPARGFLEEYTVELVPEHPVWRKCVDGVPLDSFVAAVGVDRLNIRPYNNCVNWLSGKPCLFCNLFAGRNAAGTCPPDLAEARSCSAADIKTWWEHERLGYLEKLKRAFLALQQEGQLGVIQHLCLIAGSLNNPKLEWQIGLDVMATVSSMLQPNSTDSYWNLSACTDECLLREVRDRGFSSVQMNLEVLDRDRYARVCPGKSVMHPYDSVVRALQAATRVFPRGSVRTNVLLGLQPLDEFRNGANAIAEMGVVVDCTIFQPKPGTAFGSRVPWAPRRIAEASLFLADLYRRCGFRPIYCPLSSRSSIVNECFERI